MRAPESKILPLAALPTWRAACRQAGQRLVVTNGCFDLLHRGHAAYLQQARALGEALLVALNGDSSVRALKGPTRPVMAEADRAFLLASLECVDAVCVFADRKPLAVFQAAPPDIYVKGGDYTLATIDAEERTLLQSLGADFAFIPFLPGYSTTALLARLAAT